jgi:hypothetical protein
MIMNEHRLSDRLLLYWNGMRKDLPLPDFSHFNASAIADIWQSCVLFTVSPAVENKPFVLNFDQIGDKVRDIYGNEMVGRSFNTAQRHFQGAAIVRRMEETIESPAVLNDVGQFINERSKVVKYRSCLLPFGRDGKVTHVLVGLSWREY